MSDILTDSIIFSPPLVASLNSKLTLMPNETTEPLIPNTVANSSPMLEMGYGKQNIRHEWEERRDRQYGRGGAVDPSGKFLLHFFLVAFSLPFSLISFWVLLVGARERRLRRNKFFSTTTTSVRLRRVCPPICRHRYGICSLGPCILLSLHRFLRPVDRLSFRRLHDLSSNVGDCLLTRCCSHLAMNRCAVLRLDNVQATYARRRRDADWVRSFISPLILLLKHILRTRAMQVALGEIFTGVFSVSVAPPPLSTSL